MRLRIVGLILWSLFIAGSAYAVDQYDFFHPAAGTQPVALTGGDTLATYSVTCNIASASVLRPAVTAGPANQSAGRPLRRRCFQNVGSVDVRVGSSTIIASDFYILESSAANAANGALGAPFCTTSSAAWYCGTPVGTSSGTVVILEETQSLP